MCGRFTLNSGRDELAEHYGLVDVPAFTGGYNIAPSAQVRVVRLGQEQEREAAVCHWGFIPHWVREPVLKPINTRAETLTGKPYFRDAFRRRRCLVPASGYYEWRAEGGGKQPYFIRVKGVGLFSFAGLWSSWQGADGLMESFAVITTAANEKLVDIHDNGDERQFERTRHPGLRQHGHRPLRAAGMATEAHAGARRTDGGRL